MVGWTRYEPCNLQSKALILSASPIMACHRGTHTKLSRTRCYGPKQSAPPQNHLTIQALFCQGVFLFFTNGLRTILNWERLFAV